MRFRFDPEHDELRSSLRKLLGEYAGVAGAQRLESDPNGYDPALVRRLAEEVGIFALAVPEQFGGAGFGLLELGVVFEEAGRALLCAPLLSATAATQLLLNSGDDAACAAYLPGIAAGERIAAAALVEDDPADLTAITTKAVPSGDGWALTGTKKYVLDAGAASLLLVTAAGPDGASLFTVDASAAGVEVVASPSVDLTRRLYEVSLNAAPATLIGANGDAAAGLTRTLDVLRTLLAAEQVGITGACLESATAWAKEREQFGRAIGTFQSIKHKLANVALEQEAAVSASLMALFAAQNAPADLPSVARIAAYVCGEAALLAAQENIQVHGGMGATWEHPAHYYLRRAHLDRQLFGSARQHLEALAAHADATVASTLS